MSEIAEALMKKKGAAILLVLVAVLSLKLADTALSYALPQNTTNPELVRHVKEQGDIAGNVERIKAVQEGQTAVLQAMTRTLHEATITLTRIQARLEAD